MTIQESFVLTITSHRLLAGVFTCKMRDTYAAMCVDPQRNRRKTGSQAE
jgi:hypothetical protein